MILIDALYINNSGGKVLLDYLINSLEKTDLNIFYLLDNRVKGRIPPIKNDNKVLFITANLQKRGSFYRTHKTMFRKILCFGNLPPAIKLKSTVFTYFHQNLFLKVSGEFNYWQRLLLNMKSYLIRYYGKNTDFWIVQSEYIELNLIKKYKIRDNEKVKIIPFFPDLEAKNNIVRKEDSYIYVSDGNPYKNHKRLLTAFCRFYDNYNIGELHLTVSNRYKELTETIEANILKGYPIINHGYIERNSLDALYQSCKYSIYPSITESFGLGIIEALENGCKILGADRPYMHAVCNPSLIFDPQSIEGIYDAFKKSIGSDIGLSELRVSNKIGSLIEYLNDSKIPFYA